MDTKVCRICHKTKLLSEFHRCSKVKDGHMAQCKECRNQPRRVKMQPFTPIVTLATDRLEAYKFESRHPVRSRRKKSGN